MRSDSVRVLHFFKTYYPDSVGGIEQAIRQICIGTARHGIQGEVLTLSRTSSNSIVHEGHVVHRAPLDFEIASTGFSLKAIRQFARLAQNADLIHYHFPWPFMDLAHFLGRIKRPCIVTYHSDIVRQKNLFQLYQPLMHRFLGSVDWIVASSPNYLASSPVLDRYRNKTSVIPYGLDKTLYPPASPERLERWRQRCGARFFLFVGVLRYYKGLHILLEASQGTTCPIVIAGSGPEEQALKQQARQLGLNNVLFLGSVSEEDKVALLQLCEAFVFPSQLRSEAFGLSLLEGAMYGKPMISCEIGTGTSYINRPGETGLVVPPNDPAAFRAAMHTLWENPEMAHAMAKNALARYRALFTAEKMAAEYATLYRQLTARAPRAANIAG